MVNWSPSLDLSRYGRWLAYLLGRGTPAADATVQAQAAAAGGAEPPPVGSDGLPTQELPPADDFTTGTPVPGVGGSPTQRPQEEKPPHDNPTTALERLENDQWRARKLLEEAVERASRLSPETSSTAYNQAQATVTQRQAAYQNAQNAFTAEQRRTEEAATKVKGPRTIQKQEKGPDGGTYLVTYNVDAQGNEAWDGQRPSRLDLGTDPLAGINQQTAQANLQRLQQQLAAESDPLKKRQLQVAVEQAELALSQARATAPLDLQTAQLAYDRARTEYEQATDETSRESRRVALEQARVGLDAARQGLTRGNAPQIVPTDTTSPVIMTRDPNTGALKTEPNPAYQGPTFTDATAAYNAQVPRLQQAARTERDRLLELQRQGAISEADAEKQFTQWFAGNVETPLAGYRAAAEEAQRKEQRETEALQRAENARAEAANRARETLGYQAGENARQTWMGLAGEVRTPQFLQQAGQSVANMSARANAPSAEAAAALPRGSTFSPDTFNPANFAGAVPNLDEVARNATQRALASISPAVAAQINAPMPRLPTGPTLEGMLSQIPYRGALSQLPLASSGLLPTPGVNQAQDIGGGMARTPYGPGGNVWLDWALPQG